MNKDHLTDQGRQSIIDTQYRIWNDPAERIRRSAIMKAAWQDKDEEKLYRSALLKNYWQDPEWKAKTSANQSKGAKARWADPEKRAALIAAKRAGYLKRVAARNNNDQV